jgi:hypothetical protein
MSEPTFPWEKDFDLDGLAKEHAEFHGLDLEETKRKFAEARHKIVDEMDSRYFEALEYLYGQTFVSSLTSSSPPVPHSPE